MPPYIPFTEEQKRQANLVDLSEFLRRRGEPLITSGRELRMGSNHSVTVRGNEWYDHAAERGGGPVSFLKEFHGMDYSEAVLALLGSDGGPLPQIRAPNEKVKKPFELPQANGDNRRMFAYLVKHRRLDRDVVAQFIKQGLLYEDQKYHNAVFVGRDADSTPRHAHKRSTNSQGKSFRMTVESSDFRYAFNWPGESRDLLVFEAPIDLLSFISMHPENWERHSYVALCGTSSQAMLGMLERNPQLQAVHLALDNDQAGQQASRRLAGIVRERGLEVDALVPIFKDWSDDLCASVEQEVAAQQEQTMT